MRHFASLATAAAFAFATLGAPAMALTIPTGVQNDVSLATVAAWGWTECYVASYATPLGTTYASALSACSGNKLMLAARATGGTTYDVLAAADWADVTFVTSGNTLHVANGVGWYYTANISWGFADDTDVVSRSSCDSAGQNERDRLCWHMLSNVGGYRSGNHIGLNGSTAYQKVILMANDAPAAVPEPAMLGLFGLGALGLGLSRRRA